MSDYHIAKNVFGELTFGEYWNLAGCHSQCCAVRMDGKFVYTTDFKPEEDMIFFYLEGYYSGDGSKFCKKVPLSSKVKVNKNVVESFDHLNKKVTIKFYRLEPLESPV